MTPEEREAWERDAPRKSGTGLERVLQAHRTTREVCRDMLVWLDEAVTRSEYAGDGLDKITAAMREARAGIAKLIKAFG